MQKEIEVGGKKITLNELGYFDIAELGGLSRRDWTMKVFELSGVSKEYLTKELSVVDGNQIMNAINELNGWVDFQKTSKVENQ